MRNIDSSFYEAAEIDGATGWQQFKYITFPLIKPILKIDAVLIITGSLKYYDLVAVMTSGGPNHATEVMSTYMYYQSFNILNYGYASAIGCLLYTSKIYGMGQYQQPYLNLKGTDLELAQRNSQASVPFAVSSLGYGFLWNNPGVGRVMFGKNITTWEAYSTKVLDYWITAGDSPAEIEEAYASVTGTVPMMPDYAMGFWQCKLRYQTQDELLNVAREYKKRGLPISVIVIDYFHWPLPVSYTHLMWIILLSHLPVRLQS